MLSDLDEDELEELESRLYSQIHYVDESAKAGEPEETAPIVQPLQYPRKRYFKRTSNCPGSIPDNAIRPFVKNVDQNVPPAEPVRKDDQQQLPPKNPFQVNISEVGNECAQEILDVGDNLSENSADSCASPDLQINPLCTSENVNDDKANDGNDDSAKSAGKTEKQNTIMDILVSKDFNKPVKNSMQLIQHFLKKQSKKIEREKNQRIVRAANDAEFFRTLSLEERKGVLRYQKRVRYRERRKLRKLEKEQRLFCWNKETVNEYQFNENVAVGDQNIASIGNQSQDVVEPVNIIDNAVQDDLVEIVSISGSDGSSCVAVDVEKEGEVFIISDSENELNVSKNSSQEDVVENKGDNRESENNIDDSDIKLEPNKSLENPPSSLSDEVVFVKRNEEPIIDLDSEVSEDVQQLKDSENQLKDSELMKPPDFETLSVCSVSSNNQNFGASASKTTPKKNSPSNNSLNSKLNSKKIAKERDELLSTPESNDFLDTVGAEQNFNFGLHGSDFDLSKATPSRKTLADICESESSCSASDISAPVKLAVFNEIEFDSPSKELFSENNLDSFGEFITPKRISTGLQIAPLLTPARDIFEQVQTKAVCRSASDEENSSSESDYDEGKAAMVSANKNLPELSHFEFDKTKKSEIALKKKKNPKDKKKKNKTSDADLSDDNNKEENGKKKKNESTLKKTSCKNLEANICEEESSKKKKEDPSLNKLNEEHSCDEEIVKKKTFKSASNKNIEESDNLNLEETKKKKRGESTPKRTTNKTTEEADDAKKKKRTKDDESSESTPKRIVSKTTEETDDSKKRKKTKDDESSESTPKRITNKTTEEADESKKKKKMKDDESSESTPKRITNKTTEEADESKKKKKSKDDESSSPVKKIKKKKRICDEWIEDEDNDDYNEPATNISSYLEFDEETHSDFGDSESRVNIISSDVLNSTFDFNKSKTVKNSKKGDSEGNPPEEGEECKKRKKAENVSLEQDNPEIREQEVDNSKKNDVIAESNNDATEAAEEQDNKRKRKSAEVESEKLKSNEEEKLDPKRRKKTPSCSDKKGREDIAENTNENIEECEKPPEGKRKRKLSENKKTADNDKNSRENTGEQDETNEDKRKRKSTENQIESSDANTSKETPNLEYELISSPEDGLELVSNEDSDIELIENPMETIDVEDSDVESDCETVKSTSSSGFNCEELEDVGEVDLVNLVGSTSKKAGDGKERSVSGKRKSLSDLLKLDMNVFYSNSFGEEKWDVEDFQKDMSDNPNNWKILERDRVHIQLDKDRGPRCRKCRQIGHLSYNCTEKTGPPICSLCGGRGHYEPRCPNKVCTQCGLSCFETTVYCSKCSCIRSVMCEICKLKGHRTKYCPDIWRRYHLTIEEGPINRLSGAHLKPNKNLWCCGCGKNGHLDYECIYSIPLHPPALTKIVNYDDLYELNLNNNQTEISNDSNTPANNSTLEGESSELEPNQEEKNNELKVLSESGDGNQLVVNKKRLEKIVTKENRMANVNQPQKTDFFINTDKSIQTAAKKPAKVNNLRLPKVPILKPIGNDVTTECIVFTNNEFRLLLNTKGESFLIELRKKYRLPLKLQSHEQLRLYYIPLTASRKIRSEINEKFMHFFHGNRIIAEHELYMKLKQYLGILAAVYLDNEDPNIILERIMKAHVPRIEDYVKLNAILFGLHELQGARNHKWLLINMFVKLNTYNTFSDKLFPGVLHVAFQCVFLRKYSVKNYQSWLLLIKEKLKRKALEEATPTENLNTSLRASETFLKDHRIKLPSTSKGFGLNKSNTEETSSSTPKKYPFQNYVVETNALTKTKDKLEIPASSNTTQKLDTSLRNSDLAQPSTSHAHDDPLPEYTEGIYFIKIRNCFKKSLREDESGLLYYNFIQNNPVSISMKKCTKKKFAFFLSGDINRVIHCHKRLQVFMQNYTRVTLFPKEVVTIYEKCVKSIASISVWAYTKNPADIYNEIVCIEKSGLKGKKTYKILGDLYIELNSILYGKFNVGTKDILPGLLDNLSKLTNLKTLSEEMRVDVMKKYFYIFDFSNKGIDYKALVDKHPNFIGFNPDCKSSVKGELITTLQNFLQVAKERGDDIQIEEIQEFLVVIDDLKNASGVVKYVQYLKNIYS